MTSPLDFTLRTAIRDRRLVSFSLHGLPRRAEPHDYGVMAGVPKLFFYQVGGRSHSGKPFGWRWALLSDIADLKLLEQTFAGQRAAPSGRHVTWDVIFASVSQQDRSRS